MKLRFHANSLRLRLSRGEVDQLASRGNVEDKLIFPNGNFLAYSIAAADAAGISATFDGSSIRVEVPRARAIEWAASSEAGMEETAVGLRLLIEKDFQCLHGSSAEDEDTFPNPLSAGK